MGLFDRLRDKMAAAGPDHAAEVAAALGGDRLLAHSLVIPSGYERGGGGGVSVSGRLLNMATNVVSNAVSQSRHIGGEPGSIALSLPLDADRATVLALSDAGISLWDFGHFGYHQSPPEGLFGIPRASVASIVDTGQRAQGGVPVARIGFADGSFFDYRLIDKPGEPFWTAAAGFAVRP